MRLPQIDEWWLHFKGKAYVIKGFSFAAEGDELRLLVHYRRGDGPVFSRTIENFLGPVDTRAKARFVFYSEE